MSSMTARKNVSSIWALAQAIGARSLDKLAIRASLTLLPPPGRWIWQGYFPT